MENGRLEIFTDEREITSDNIIQVLQNAIPKHMANASRMDFLLNYEAGVQPLTRTKNFRPDIDCQAVDNVANEVTEFKLGYNWGFPITLVQRGEIDKNNLNQDYNAVLPPVSDEAKAIALLNECYEAENATAKTQQLGRFVEICGVGYTFADIKKNYVKGDSFFQYEVLDPRYTFLIKSSYYLDHRTMVGVSFRVDELGQYFITAITKDEVFMVDSFYHFNKDGSPKRNRKGDVLVEWTQESGSGQRNPLGMIPITEYFRSYDRMGCFERQISEMDNLNLLVSDFTNDVDQNTQAIWHTNDVELEKTISTDSDGNTTVSNTKPSANDWIHTFTSQDGKTPFIKPLSIDYDYSGMLNNIISRRALILQKCYVPQRTENTNGATGIATGDATGWSAAETAACKQQMITDSCKMNEVRIVLSIIEKSTDVPADSPLLKLSYSDVQVNIKRQRTYEMTSKINAYATGVSHGIAPEHMIRAINLFNDPQQVIEDSKPYLNRFLDSIYTKKESHLNGDESDQIANSPNLNL